MSETEQARLELAIEISKSAGRLTLDYFQTDRFQVERKRDGSPLTIADQESEKHLRARIAERFPEDGIVGEEFGEQAGNNDVRWVLDPIDGTKSFVSGVPLYGTMVGIEIGGVAKIGAVYIPGLDEGIYACSGQGAWHYKGDGEPVRAAVSQKTDLSDCVLVTSEVEGFYKREAGEVYQGLAQQVFIARTWGDVYGYLLVATGRVDIMIDPELNVWDACAVKPIIEEAGGRFTDWAGEDRIDGGDGIGTNGRVHDQVLKMSRATAQNKG